MSNYAVQQLFEAHREGDPFRVEAAMRQLEFLDAMRKLSQYLPQVVDSDSRRL